MNRTASKKSLHDVSIAPEHPMPEILRLAGNAAAHQKRGSAPATSISPNRWESRHRPRECRTQHPGWAAAWRKTELRDDKEAKLMKRRNKHFKFKTRLLQRIR